MILKNILDKKLIQLFKQIFNPSKGYMRLKKKLQYHIVWSQVGPIQLYN